METSDRAQTLLRITHFLPTLRLADGGVARAVLDWCKVFAERGHAVTLLCHEAKDVPAEWMREELTAGHPRCVVAPRRGRGLRRSAVEHAVMERTDVLHLHAPWEVGNLRYARCARRFRIPYILSVHGMLDDWSMSQRSLKKRIYLALAGRRLLNHAAVVHCTAEAELAQASQWFSNAGTAVLPYIVDLSPFEQLPGVERGQQLISPEMRGWPKVLFLSRLHEKKGVDVLIRAAGLLRDSGMRVLTLIAGTGDADHEKQLRNLVVELKLADRVVFLGLVTGVEKISLLQAVELLALPTQQENFGLVLTEAMACGTAVLTTQGTDIWKEIQAAGAVIADRTPDAFASAIRNLLENEADRQERGRRGREWVFSTLAVEPLSRKYEMLYRHAINTRR